jgi:hypothetical protein
MRILPTSRTQEATRQQCHHDTTDHAKTESMRENDLLFVQTEGEEE